MMAEGVARRDAVAGAALAAGVAAVVAPQAAEARGSDGKETGAFAAESYSKYQKGRPRNQAPIVSFPGQVSGLQSCGKGACQVSVVPVLVKSSYVWMGTNSEIRKRAENS